MSSHTVGLNMLSYNIHDILTINTNTNAIPSQLKTRDYSLKPDLTIHLGNFTFDPSEVSHDYSYYANRRQIFFKTKFLLEDIQGRTRIMYTSPRWTIFKRIRQPISRLSWSLILIKLLQKGCSLLHSACLAWKGRGFLLIAPPETGKTFTTLSLINQGFEYLSDDVCIIDGSNAYSWPSDMTLHPGHIKHNLIDINLREMVELNIREWSTNLPFLRLTREMRVKPNELFREEIMKSKVKIERAYFLNPRGNSISEINDDLAFRNAVISNELCPLKINTPELLNYALEHSDFLNIDKYSTVMRKIIKKTFNNIPCFEIKSKNREFDKIILGHLNQE